MPGEDEEVRGRLLRQARLQAAYTQQQLADFAQVSVRTIRDLESGRATRPQRRSLERLAYTLGFSATRTVAFLADWQAIGVPQASVTQLASSAADIDQSLDLPADRVAASYRNLAHFVTVVISSARQVLRVKTCILTEALVNGLDRRTVMYGLVPGLDLNRLTIDEQINVGVGGTRELHTDDGGLLAVELLFDRTLNICDTHRFEYTWNVAPAYRHRTDQPPPTPTVDALTGIRCTTQVYSQQVHFQGCTPVDLQQVHGRSKNEVTPRGRPLLLGKFGIAEMVTLNPPPGVHGITWNWPTPLV